MIDVVSNLQSVLQRIRTLEVAYQRAPQSVALLAVTKTQPLSLIEALFDAGQHDFGENYLQEALPKISALAHKQLIWHFIGPIQSKKAALIAQHFSWVHTLSRIKEAELLAAHRPASLGPLNICIQVKLDDNPNRAGASPEEVPALVSAIKQLASLRLRGLMTLPPYSENFEEQRRYFNLLKNLLRHINDEALDTLSMGMSADLEAAIAEGATIVRLGTALFGQRSI